MLTGLDHLPVFALPLKYATEVKTSSIHIFFLSILKTGLKVSVLQTWIFFHLQPQSMPVQGSSNCLLFTAHHIIHMVKPTIQTKKASSAVKGNTSSYCDDHSIFLLYHCCRVKYYFSWNMNISSCFWSHQVNKKKWNQIYLLSALNQISVKVTTRPWISTFYWGSSQMTVWGSRVWN